MHAKSTDTDVKLIGKNKSRVQSNKCKAIYYLFLNERKTILIQEIWLVFLSFCFLIVIINFNGVCSDFFRIIYFDKRFVNRRKLVNFITNYGELLIFFLFSVSRTI